MGVRRNGLDAPDDLRNYLNGCVALSQLPTGFTAGDINDWLNPQLPGWAMDGDPNQPISYWDFLVVWHWAAMTIPTPGTGSNRAHGGPVFLPWHRMFLVRLEGWLQQILDDTNFGLPYWDWAADRTLDSPLWTTDLLGTNRGRVTTGRLAGLRLRLFGQFSASLGNYVDVRTTPRSVERTAGLQGVSLPRKTHVAACLTESTYDESTWDLNTRSGLRNRLEGWQPQTGLHNAVHVWVGGDMGPGTSPNDPVFYLNHCNVDRIWEAWMTGPNGRTYLPDGTPGSDVAGQNIDQPMIALVGPALTPRQTLNMTGDYTYDTLAVDQ